MKIVNKREGTEGEKAATNSHNDLVHFKAVMMK
jgi:hypothetical protein